MARTKSNASAQSSATIGFEAAFGPEHADTFRRDLHPNLGADYVLANSKHSSTLTTLRAMLLPKLLGGELSISQSPT